MNDAAQNYTQIEVLKERMKSIEQLNRFILAVSGTNLLGIIITILALVIL